MANTLPGCGVELSEGEIVVRCYHITEMYSRFLKKQEARGDITVTNKRLIYQGKGKTSLIVNEIPIESVSAVNTFMGSGFNIGNLLLGIGFLIAAIALIFTVIFFIIGLVLAFIFLSGCFNSGYGLTIKTSDIKGVGVSLGQSDVTRGGSGGILSKLFASLFSTSGQGAVLARRASPTQEALVLMNELGALVLDLKIMGDRAIPKWQNRQAAPVDTSIYNSKLSDVINLQGFKKSLPFGTGQQVPSQGMPGMPVTPPPGVPHSAPPVPGMSPPPGASYHAPPAPGMSPPPGVSYNAPPAGMSPPPGVSHNAPPAPGMSPPPGTSRSAPPPPPGVPRNVPPPNGTGSDNGGFFG